MEFLVCISKAPDTTTRIAFTEGDTRFNEEGVQFIVNPYDEWYALVRALELVEAGGGKVVIASVGGADVDPILRKALAIGAHEAVRIDANPQDAGQVAAELAAYAKDKGFNAILDQVKNMAVVLPLVSSLHSEFMEKRHWKQLQELGLGGSTH